MRSAVIVLSMVAAIVAEAPYHLPRPAAHAPSFNYPAAPAPPPPPPPPPHPHSHPHPRPQPQFIQYPPQPAPAPQFNQVSGYHYQQPNIAPAFVQPVPQAQPHYHHHPPAPQPIPIQSYPQQQYAQPLPQSLPQGPSGYAYSQPQPHFPSAPRPQLPPASIQPAPLPAYIAPHPQPAPLPSYSSPHPQPVPLPSYASPQPQPAPLPAYVPQPQARPAPAIQPAPHYQPQVPSQQGYSYQQPQNQYISQFPAHTQPLQAQPLANNVVSSALSSYEADSNQYSGASVQSRGEGLDATVVDRVQNIIKESEHTSARDAGYLSLVSGVSLEQARPSIEISSFVHNSGSQSVQSSEQSLIDQSSSSQASSAPAAAVAPSQDYGLPIITANSQAAPPDASLAFLPQTKPATSYGSPQ